MSARVLSAMRWLEPLRQSAVDLAFPPRCAACAVAVDPPGRALPLCDECRRDLGPAEGERCPRCAAQLPAGFGDVPHCSRCHDVKLRFDRALALGEYDGALRTWVLRMKRDRWGLETRMLVELLWQRLGGALAALGIDAVTSVPPPRLRRWLRNLDPVRTAAELLAVRLGVPARPGALRRVRKIPPQIGLTRPARFRNVAGGLAAGPGYPWKGRHLLLVDDVLTTGATASEAARALRKAGAAQVSVVVFARTPA